ncbi:MAG: SDR family NAD(P)-dependent oxidoreductase [Anaerolineae bacterium]|nr:SDR family NAD(P)-dependent oxidoreductase [Anaerolineae bacterium]
MEGIDLQTLSRVVIITGASTGIGEATARRFAREGWCVVLAARSEAKLTRLQVAIEAQGGRALAVRADVTQQEDVARIVERALAAFGRIDVLINNAGVGISGTLDSLGLDVFEYALKLNVLAPIAMLQAVFPTMKRQGSGVIVNVSSMIEAVAVPYMAGYGASKAALGYLSDAAAIELDEYNIAVIRVLPGMTETNFNANLLKTGEATSLETLFERAGLLKSVSPERVADAIWEAVLSRRRLTYVTVEDGLLVQTASVNPGVTNRFLRFAVRRYAPRKGTASGVSVKADIVRLERVAGLLLAAAALGTGVWLARRGRSESASA